jgi:gamma-glutamyltranspeptidase / glutathione hydrolase
MHRKVVKHKGVVAAGHRQTAKAAQLILEEGGNAFDAALAAQFAACVAEPVFTSLGGGGFMLARRARGESMVYDFFTQTPLRPPPSKKLHFYPAYAEFGTARQEFHIGMGAIATPGMVKGLFRIHAELGTLPMERIVEPAVRLARRGVRMNALQAYCFVVVQQILRATAQSLAIYRSPDDGRRLLREGELLKQPLLADTLEALAHEGERLFYKGEIGQRIARDCREGGGTLGVDDFSRYRVVKRKPLTFRYHDYQVLTNPPPSSGGVLIAFTLKLLEQYDLRALGFGSAEHLALLAHTMDTADRARVEIVASRNGDAAAATHALISRAVLHAYRDAARERLVSQRGTTHISVIDAKGNLASVTTSNGEGCGYVAPGTGIMLNNMLGEDDINPAGFHRGPPGQRLSSMLSPTLILGADGSRFACGSGGSKRIRTAMLQVLLNLMSFRMPVASAVGRPRIHYEGDLLSLEGGFRPAELRRLGREFPRRKLWPQRNLFFGGVHTAGYDMKSKRFLGAGDPRRGGVCIKVRA